MGKPRCKSFEEVTTLPAYGRTDGACSLSLHPTTLILTDQTVISTKNTFMLIALLWLSGDAASAQDDLNVISKWLRFTDARNSLYHHFAGEAFEHLSKRREYVASLKSLDQWKQRQKWIRETLLDIVGPFPEKSPLNAKVLRTLDKDFYRVEHIVFESQPGFLVTSSLFIPKAMKRRDRAPAIIYCSGHTPLGYRSDAYQHVILNLVRKGFVVFAFDPVGQGERLEYFDEKQNKSALGRPTAEHSYPGAQAFITGSSQARYMIWDGIRAVDYLLTRKEVDPERVGITGRSGGGTQSAYIAAFDERIKAAAPENYITNYTRLLQSIGPQDAEQNFVHAISKGFDHGDLLIVRAPRPTLMITTSRDIFNIHGARETAHEVSRIFEAYGEGKSFAMTQDDAAHESTKKNREEMYAFFRKHLALPGPVADEEVAKLSPEEMRVTPTGQLSTSLGSETVFSLNRKEAADKVEELTHARQNKVSHSRTVIDAAGKLSGYREPQNVDQPVFTGRIQRDGYAIEKYFIAGEGDYVIPYLLLTPDAPNGTTAIYLDPAGKGAAATAGPIAALLRKGFTVLAADLPGTGELGPGEFRGDAYIDGISHNIWYASILVGRSIAGLHAGDIARLASAAKSQHQATAVYGIAVKELTPSLLHAAAFNADIERIALIDPLPSYRSLVMNRTYHSRFIPGSVAGALTSYDLPDLAGALNPRKLLLVDMTASGSATAEQQGREDYQAVSDLYKRAGASKALSIREADAADEVANFLMQWSEGQKK